MPTWEEAKKKTICLVFFFFFEEKENYLLKIASKDWKIHMQLMCWL